jgi:RNA polymerase sigma-70 factor (ECF subfamily)
MSSESFDQAFHALFEGHSERLYRYLYRLCGDAALAEDIVQECFVRLHQRGSSPDDPPAWLVTVANNLLRDDRRRVGRRRRLLLERSAEAPAGDPTPAPDAATLAGERIAAVRRALAFLPLRDQQLLLLRHEGYGYREIAEILDVAPSGVGTMLVRATDAFRKAYDELYGTSP